MEKLSAFSKDDALPVVSGALNLTGRHLSAPSRR